MDYTGAERLKNALEKLEKSSFSMANIGGSNNLNNENTESLQIENNKLKAKQELISQEIDDLILTVETAIKSENIE